MRLRLTLLLIAFLTPAGALPAQTITSPPAAPAPAIPWPSDPPPSSARLWANAEYLLWWTRSAPLPVPLVTTSNTADFGVLGAPSTRLLIGNENLNFGARNGARLTLGGWLDDAQTFGLEGSFFFLASSSVTRSAAVNGLSPQFISIPFIDRTPGGNFGVPSSFNQENAFVFGAPFGTVTPSTAFAGIAVLSVKDQLWSTEANGLFNVARTDALRLDGLAGFRYVYFRERLGLDTSSPTVVPQTPGEFFVTNDNFDGHNDFYGAQVGARLTWGTERLTVAATGKVALGVMHEQLVVNGFYSTNDVFTNGILTTGPRRTFPGGYFALPSNSGHFQRDRFGVVPEVGLNVSYRITRRLSLSAGYTFLYLNSVVRPGEQIDRNINGGQSALYSSPNPPPGLQGGVARPAPLFRDSDFWAQGISFGLQLRF